MGSLGWKLAALGIPCYTELGDSGKDCRDLQDSNARQDRNRGGVARPAPPRECRCGLPPCAGPCTRARRSAHERRLSNAHKAEQMGHSYSSLANCVLQMLLAAEVLGL